MSRWPRVLLMLAVVIPAVIVPAAAASADPTFPVSDLTAHYTLTRDSGDIYRLDAVARYTIPNTQANGGSQFFVGLLTERQGVDLKTTIESVVDENGEEVPYGSEIIDGRYWIGMAPSRRADGESTYVVTYSQENVAVPEDSSSDWIVRLYNNGFTSGTVYDSVDLTLEVANEIWVDASQCRRGSGGGWSDCKLFETSTDDAVIYNINETLVHADETVQLVVGVNPSATSIPVESLTVFGEDYPRALSLVCLILIALALGVFLFKKRRVAGRRTIIAEYEAPDGLNIMVAAHLVGRPKTAIPAELLWLASNRNLRVIERLMRRGRRGWAVQFLTFDNSDELGRALLEALFGSAPPTNRTVELRAGDRGLARRITGVSARALKETRVHHWRSGGGAAQWVLLVLSVLTIPIEIAFAFLSFLTSSYTHWVLASFFLVPITIGVSLATIRLVGPITAAGAQLRDHLLGLREYLELAEEDRMRILYSVEGSERSTNADAARVIRINEALLPYAVVWGVEQSWLRALVGNTFDFDAPPEWLSSSNSLTILSASSAVRGLGSQTRRAFASNLRSA